MLLDDLAALRPPYRNELRLAVVAQVPRRLLGGVHARRVHFPLMIQQLLGVKLLVVVLGGVGRLWSVFELRRVPSFRSSTSRLCSDCNLSRAAAHWACCVLCLLALEKTGSPGRPGTCRIAMLMNGAPPSTRRSPRNLSSASFVGGGSADRKVLEDFLRRLALHALVPSCPPSADHAYLVVVVIISLPRRF